MFGNTAIGQSWFGRAFGVNTTGGPGGEGGGGEEVPSVASAASGSFAASGMASTTVPSSGPGPRLGDIGYRHADYYRSRPKSVLAYAAQNKRRMRVSSF